MEKKYNMLPLIIIFVIGITINIFFFKNDIVVDDTASKIINDKVFNYTESRQYFLDKPNDFNNYYLLFDEIKLNTNNFISVFNAFKKEELLIKKVYPYINPLYEDKLRKRIGEIYFGNNISLGINNLVNRYIDVLDEYGLDNEINKVNMYGVNIRIVLVNIRNKTMYEFLINNKNIKFSTSQDGIYYKIK